MVTRKTEKVFSFIQIGGFNNFDNTCDESKKIYRLNLQLKTIELLKKTLEVPG